MNWPDIIASNSNALFLVKNGSSAVQLIDDSRSPYFGITWDFEQKLYVACGYGNHGNAKLAVFDQQLSPIDEIQFFARYPHQIIFHDRLIYITLTASNAVTSMDVSERSVRQVFHTGGKTFDVDVGEDHVNSIWFAPEGTCYICEHRQSDRFQRPSRISVLKGHDDGTFSLTRRIEIGRAAHNVYVEHGMLYVCDSMSNSLNRLCIRTNDIKVVDLEAFTRGLARFDQGFVVGLSDVGVRSTRDKGSSRLVLLDNELNKIDEVTLDIEGGIHDLRVVGQIDYAHDAVSKFIIG